MRVRVVLAVLVAVAGAGDALAADQSWENPVFSTAEEAVASAKGNLLRLDSTSPEALRLFVDLTLAEGDVDPRHTSSSVTREVVEHFLVTHPTAFSQNVVQRGTIERFKNEMPRQRAVLEKRLARFGYPDLPGLVYLRLVDSVDAFAGLNRASTERMTQIGGLTYYCRYIVLPLSYVGEENLRELRRSAALNPSLDVDDTVRRWQRDSFANLINTFRHELVHVHTNATLGVPAYSNRRVHPTWFHEGTATYLAADPHSGLSKGYQEFQDLFFYLAQRFGVGRLQAFYAGVLGGGGVQPVLANVYAISGTDQLFARSSRWHHAKGVVQTGFWLVAMVIVTAAFRGADGPYVGLLQLLASLAIVFAVATGVAEHLYGLRGPAVVLTAKAGFALVAAIFAVKGVRRIRRHRMHRSSS